MKSETVFRRRVVKFLRTLPFCKIFSIQQKAITGHPDIMLCLDGLFVALEIKADDGKPSPRQVLVLEEVLKAKGAALIVYPKNMEEIKEILLKLSKGIRYDKYEVQRSFTPSSSERTGKDCKHTNGSGKKLRSKQASSSSEKRDQQIKSGEQGNPEDFREI